MDRLTIAAIQFASNADTSGVSLILATGHIRLGRSKSIISAGTVGCWTITPNTCKKYGQILTQTVDLNQYRGHEEGRTMSELFVVKHYTAEDRPTIKGNGFDGLEIGDTREESEAFILFVNNLISTNSNFEMLYYHLVETCPEARAVIESFTIGLLKC